MNAVRKRSVTIRGHRTSFSLEQPFFDDALRLAEKTGTPLASLVAEIDQKRDRSTNLSSALRLHILDCAKKGLLS